jgi:hypothetical protein
MRRIQIVLPVVAAVVIAVGIATATSSAGQSAKAKPKPLPVKKIEAALQVKGEVGSGGVFTAEVDRTDINNVKLDSPAGKVPVKPSWELNGTVAFQPLAHGKALFNGDLALKPSEIDPFIAAVVHQHLTFQAEHQHMYDFSPMVWFVHWRGVGSPVQLAQRVHDVIATTSTPLPQSPPSNPATPLNAKRLQKILHGFSASVGSDGVVTVDVARKDPIHLGGNTVDPATNIATNIGFEPLNGDGSDTAVMPDFGMTANEVDRVVGFMHSHGWDIGCLYNQETDEHPQLYFSHEFKEGDAYALAKEVRQALDLTNTK